MTSERNEETLKKIKCLQQQLTEETLTKYKRMNPLCEDIGDWKERGELWLKRPNANVTIYQSTTVNGDVEIGDNTWIGGNCSLDGGGGLVIGKNCSISNGVQLLTHDTVKWALSGGKQPYSYNKTIIGDYCFIGTYAVILKGVVLGNQCVVAAGAVVRHSFPDRTIIAGNPAVKIGDVVLDNNEVKLVYHS